ncbi:hypothetical protein V8E36_007594 [Tilletia maclaganii]
MVCGHQEGGRRGFLMRISLLLILIVASAVVEVQAAAVPTTRPGLVRRSYRAARRSMSFAKRAPVDLVTSDGSLSLRKLLELRQAQQLELEQWWNGTSKGNSSWTLKPDNPWLQIVLPSRLQYPGLQLNSSSGEAFWWNISGYYKASYSVRELVPSQKNKILGRGRAARADSRTNGTAADADTMRGNFPWLDPAGGIIDLEMSEEHNLSDNITMITGSLFLKSLAQSRSMWSAEVISGASVRFDLTGMHYLASGGFLISALPAESSTVPDGRDVLAMIPPQLLPANDSNSAPYQNASPMLNETFQVLNRSLTNEIARLDDRLGSQDQTEPLAAPTDDRITHNCTDLHLYMRLKPATVPNASPAEIQQVRDYERELFYSTGASPMGLLGQRAPPLVISDVIIYSEKCNLIIRPQSMAGLRYIAHRRKIMRAALCLALLTFIQLRLTMGMMRRARTASTRIKIDWRTLLLQTVADMYTSILCAIPAVVWRNETDLLLAAVSYVIGCHFVGGEYQFLIFVVHDSQNDPLNNRPTPAVTATATAPTPAPAPAGMQSDQASVTPGTNAPVESAAAPAAATPDPVDQLANEWRQRTYRYIGILTFFFLLNFQPLVFFSILGPVLYSFWIPQIMRNVRRGSRRPFPRMYVLGMTTCRCLLPLYFWQCPANIFFWEPTSYVWILIGYLWAQALILLLQDELGPAFFLPARFQPEGPPSWDWHPPLSILRKHIRQSGGGGGGAVEKTGGDAKVGVGGGGDLVAEAHADARAQAGHGQGQGHSLAGGGHVGAQYEIEIGDCAICLSEIEPLRWDWRDEEAEAERVRGGEEESEDDDDEAGPGAGDEYAYVSVDGGGGGGGGADAEAEAEGDGAARRKSSASRRTTVSAGPSGPGPGPLSPDPPHRRRRRHVRTGSLIASWASSAVRVGRRVGRAISAAREHGGRGRSGAAAASAALGGGRTDIMVAPCHHIFHTECLERWLQYKSECPSCRTPLPPA